MEVICAAIIVGLLIGGILTLCFCLACEGLAQEWDEYRSIRCMLGRHDVIPESVWSYQMTEGRIGTNSTCARCGHTNAKIRYAR